MEEHDGMNWHVTRSWPGQQFLMFMSSPCTVPPHFYFFFPAALQNRCCQHSHFTDENVEAYNPKCFPKDSDSRLTSHAQSLLYRCPGSLQHTHHSDPCLLISSNSCGSFSNIPQSTSQIPSYVPDDLRQNYLLPCVYSHRTL